MRSMSNQLIIGMAIAIGLSAVGASTIVGAVAQATVERAPVFAEDTLRGSSADEARLSDRQQLKHYFLAAILHSVFAAVGSSAAVCASSG